MIGLTLFEGLIVDACRYAQCSKNELLSPVRQQNVVAGRALVVWGLRSLGKPLSYPRIAQLMGYAEHTTALHMNKKAEILRDYDRQFRAITDQLYRFYMENSRDA